MVPPHRHQVKPFFKGFATLNLSPCYTRPNRGVNDFSRSLYFTLKLQSISETYDTTTRPIVIRKVSLTDPSSMQVAHGFKRLHTSFCVGPVSIVAQLGTWMNDFSTDKRPTILASWAYLFRHYC